MDGIAANFYDAELLANHHSEACHQVDTTNFAMQVKFGQKLLLQKNKKDGSEILRCVKSA